MADALLIIGNDSRLTTTLHQRLDGRSWEIERAGSLAEAARLLLDEGREPLVVLADSQLPDGSSLDLLERLHDRPGSAAWVLLGERDSAADTVRALRLGALDCIDKPFDIERLELVLNGARRGALALRRLHRQIDAEVRRYRPHAWLGRSEAAQRVRAALERLAETPFNGLLISGERGTGKSLAARILHHSGLRAGAPLVEINCAALPRELLETALFGGEARGFTHASPQRCGYLRQADGGALFLDDVAALDADLQARLVRTIEGGGYAGRADVQIFAAGGRDLQQRVRDGRFRSDLYHRLDAFRIDLPALRERPEDLYDLVPALVEEFNGVAGRQVRRIPDGVYTAMKRYHWPGNVRELRNVVERCVMLSDGELFPRRWLHLRGATGGDGEAGLDGERLIIPLDGSMALDEMDRCIIQNALRRNRFNVTATARSLGTTRETLRYRIQKYQLRTQGGFVDAAGWQEPERPA